jgi:hypothetical protein
MKQITHEDARLLINAYEGLVEWCGLTKKSMHDSRILGLRNYITQQEKVCKLLELYRLKDDLIEEYQVNDNTLERQQTLGAISGVREEIQGIEEEMK